MTGSAEDGVARAILKVQFYDGEEAHYDGLDGFYRDIDPDHYFIAMAMARAALVAIREMDGAMWLVGRKEFEVQAERFRAADRYEAASAIADRAPEHIMAAMIDAAIGPTTTKYVDREE